MGGGEWGALCYPTPRPISGGDNCQSNRVFCHPHPCWCSSNVQVCKVTTGCRHGNPNQHFGFDPNSDVQGFQQAILIICSSGSYILKKLIWWFYNRVFETCSLVHCFAFNTVFQLNFLMYLPTKCTRKPHRYCWFSFNFYILYSGCILSKILPVLHTSRYLMRIIGKVI